MNTLDYIKNKFNPELTEPYTEVPGDRKKEFPDMFRDLGFTKGAEIGVETGVYSEIICKANPKLTLYCIDPWIAYNGYEVVTDQKILDNFYQKALIRLAPYNCKIIKDYSEQGYKKFDDASLDFVYIDGNHNFDFVTQDIVNWLPKIRSGGIIAGHDFHYRPRHGTNEVEKAVLTYTTQNNIRPLFVLKAKGSPSWFWVKT